MLGEFRNKLFFSKLFPKETNVEQNTCDFIFVIKQKGTLHLDFFLKAESIILRPYLKFEYLKDLDYNWLHYLLFRIKLYQILMHNI